LVIWQATSQGGGEGFHHYKGLAEMNLFRQLISDENTLNEQSFVGIVSFFAMVFVFLIDTITGIMGIELVIKEYIFDGFMILTLGAFGINTAGKVIKPKKNETEQ
jgi:hypothetical protein